MLAASCIVQTTELCCKCKQQSFGLESEPKHHKLATKYREGKMTSLEFKSALLPVSLGVPKLFFKHLLLNHLPSHSKQIQGLSRLNAHFLATF